MTAARPARADSIAGFTLIEVLVALALLATMAAGSAALFVVGTEAARRARVQTSATMLGVQKLEQLRALSWGGVQADGGPPVTDTVTDLSRDPPTTLGTGLGRSPSGSLDVNLAGFVDFLDEAGRWVGSGTSPPPRAVWIRRWSVQPLDLHSETLVLQVYVTGTGRPGTAVRLVSIKTRKAG